MIHVQMELERPRIRRQVWHDEGNLNLFTPRWFVGDVAGREVSLDDSVAPPARFQTSAREVFSSGPRTTKFLNFSPVFFHRLHFTFPLVFALLDSLRRSRLSTYQNGSSLSCLLQLCVPRPLIPAAFSLLAYDPHSASLRLERGITGITRELPSDIPNATFPSL